MASETLPVTPPSSPQSVSSDLELEVINPGPLTLVTFDEVKKLYGPDDEIEVSYLLDTSYKPSSRDWLGLYREGWRNPRQYVTFQWAPKHPKDTTQPLARTILFGPQSIQDGPNNQQFYHFMYLTRFDDVIGMSEKFQFGDPLTKMEASFVCIERPLVAATEQQDVDDEEDGDFHLVASPTPALSLHSMPASSSQSDHDDATALVQESLASDAAHVHGDVTPDEAHVQDNSNVIQDQKSLARDHFNKKAPGTVDHLSLNLDLLDPVQRWRVCDLDPKMEHYIQNQERALLPYSSFSHLYKLAADWKQSRPLLKLSPNTSTHSTNTPVISKVSVGTVAALERDSSPPRTPPGSGRDPDVLDLVWRPACTGCSGRRKQFKEIQGKCASFWKDTRRLKKQLKGAEDNLAIKAVLLEELSKQVKLLVHENTNLITTNDRLAATSKDHLQQRKPSQSELKMGRRVQALRQKVLHLETQNERLQKQCDVTQCHQNEACSKVDSLEAELKALNGYNSQLEKRLDDIMYTLSTQGYTKIVDTNGNVTELSGKKGSVLELTGWSLALNKKHSRELSVSQLQAAVSSMSEERDHLKAQLQHYKTQLCETTHQVEQSKHQTKEQEERTRYYHQKVDTLTSQLTSLLDQRCSLSRVLSEQGRLYQVAQSEHKLQQARIEEQLARLQKRVEAYSSQAADTTGITPPQDVTPSVLRFLQHGKDEGMAATQAPGGTRPKYSDVTAPGAARPISSIVCDPKNSSETRARPYDPKNTPATRARPYDPEKNSEMRGEISAEAERSAQSQDLLSLSSPSSYDSSIIMWAKEMGSMCRDKIRLSLADLYSDRPSDDSLLKMTEDQATQVNNTHPSYPGRKYPRKFVFSTTSRTKQTSDTGGVKWPGSGGRVPPRKETLKQTTRGRAGCPYCPIVFPTNVSAHRITRHVKRHQNDMADAV